MRVSLHPDALAYSMTTLGAAMMNSIFSFYYVKLFLNRYGISESDFHQSQVIYMVWNAANDPLFGYLQDHWGACSRRRLWILFGAPIYCLSFLLAWFPWYTPGDPLSGLHLTLTLCAFDGALTLVLLAQCALFAEISAQHRSRLRLVKYSQVASLLGSCSVLLAGLASANTESLAAFQGVAVGVAALACGCLLYTGLRSEGGFDGGVSERKGALSVTSVLTFTGQILGHADFRLFVLMNFFQVFMLAFWSNFTMIFAEHLIPRDVLPSLARSLMYGAGFICPQVLVLVCQDVLQRVGYYRLILISFYVEAAAAGAMFVLGASSYYCLAAFLTANLVLVQAAFSLFNLPLADIIDSDLQKHKRSSPLSSMVFGTNALFTKPAQSLAPMLVVTLLNQYGYQDSAHLSDPQALHASMFELVCVLPLCVSLLQALVWRRFSIRDSHTLDHKHTDG